MAILVKIMIILLIVFPITILVCVCYFPKRYYNFQQAILKKITPESPEDLSKLLINGSIALLSLWCILFVFLSFIEQIFMK